MSGLASNPQPLRIDFAAIGAPAERNLKTVNIACAQWLARRGLDQESRFGRRQVHRGQSRRTHPNERAEENQV